MVSTLQAKKCLWNEFCRRYETRLPTIRWTIILNISKSCLSDIFNYLYMWHKFDCHGFYINMWHGIYIYLNMVLTCTVWTFNASFVEPWVVLYRNSIHFCLTYSNFRSCHTNIIHTYTRYFQPRGRSSISRRQGLCRWWRPPWRSTSHITYYDIAIDQLDDSQ
jgi:hypothetical protein